MTERFLLEINKAVSDVETAFILDQKTGLRAQIFTFRTLRQLDDYQPGGYALPVRNLPILLEAQPNELSEKNNLGVLKRMIDWYYYTQLKPGPADTLPASGSAN